MIEIDGRVVAACEGTVLDACREAGSDVPAFCAPEEPDAPRPGHCRACIVEVDGRLVPACTTPIREGMQVQTASARVLAYRRDLGELMLADARPGGPVGDALQRWGATGERYARAAATRGADRSHPYLRWDLDACVLCRRCIDACARVQGRFVLGVMGRGAGARLAWGGGTFAETLCTSCGACVQACPTGAASDVQRQEAARSPSPGRVTRTTCSYCGVGCQLEVHAIADRVVHVDGVRDAQVNRGHLCVKGRYAHGFARHPDRLRQPLVRRGGTLRPASWDEAISTVVEGFDRARGHVAAVSSARCTNEENYLVQKWMRAGLGTNDVDCCARVCHAPSAVGLSRTFGTGAATSSYDDIERADLIFVAGANPTEAHPVLGARIARAALDGAGLIVIDPRRTDLAEIADVHLRVRPGANVPLLNALACAIVEEGLTERWFVETRTEGFAELERFVRGFSPERTEARTGVPAADVRHAARLYAGAARPLQVHGLGITEHHQGSEAAMLLCNLAMLVGGVGRPGAGVNPLRGQNNVQGAADMGCQPDRFAGYADVGDPEARARLLRVWNHIPPATPGRTLPRMFDAMLTGAIRALYVLGEDLVHSDPETARVLEALSRLDLLVVQEIFLSRTAELAHVVLPGASFLEKDGTFTNGERRVQRVRRVIDPPGEARADWEILQELMTATGLPQQFGHPEEIFAEIARAVPSYAGISYARLEGDGLQWPVPSPDHPGTPVLHTDRFARGRGAFVCIDDLPSPSLATVREGDLVLTTGRVLAHYNTGSMTRRTDDARLVRSDALEIHPVDASARSIADGDPVVVASLNGEAHAHARVTDRVPPGTVFLSFHFPETDTNRVTGAVLDRLADCPEYKLTPVQVHRE